MKGKVTHIKTLGKIHIRNFIGKISKPTGIETTHLIRLVFSRIRIYLLQTEN